MNDTRLSTKLISCNTIIYSAVLVFAINKMAANDEWTAIVLVVCLQLLFLVAKNFRMREKATLKDEAEWELLRIHFGK